MNSFRVIAAVDENSGLGKEGDLAWHLPGDMAYFKRITSSPPDPGRVNTVIMGRKTWESIPPRFRPLRGRTNIVVTRQKDYDVGTDAVRVNSFDAALEAAQLTADIGYIFVVGGGAIYALAVKHEHCGLIYLTRIEAAFECDTFFPKLPDRFREEERSELHEDNGVGYRYVTYTVRD